VNCYAYHLTGHPTRAVEAVKKALSLLSPNDGKNKSTLR